MVVSHSLGFAGTDLDKTVKQSGLSGSFLASRIALSEQDDAAAVEFLIRANAIDPDNPKQLLTRLRRLFGRIRMDQMELNILRGFLSAIDKKIK